jgi:hypothetical protein
MAECMSGTEELSGICRDARTIDYARTTNRIMIITLHTIKIGWEAIRYP